MLKKFWSLYDQQRTYIKGMHIRKPYVGARIEYNNQLYQIQSIDWKNEKMVVKKLRPRIHKCYTLEVLYFA